MSNKLPPSLVRKLQDHPFFDLDAFLNVHDSDERVTSIRLNPAKCGRGSSGSALRILQDQDQVLSQQQRVPWCDQGIYLSDRPVFTLDPLFHAGCYYVQEASSMFLAHVLKSCGLNREALRALDLCASPGGKSTLLQSYLPKGSLLVANEPIKSRANTLSDNLARWGYAEIVVTNSDASAFGRLPGFFDLLVVDAPCSGSGMMRKDPAVVDEWSEAAVKLCSERQQRILADSIPCLKEGGILIYSTCSYSSEENEDIGDWLVEEYGLEAIDIPLEDAWGIVPSKSPKHACPGYRFYPHLLQGEGFYLSVFRKVCGSETGGAREYGRHKPEKNAVEPIKLQDWVVEPEHYFNFSLGTDLYVFPADRQPELARLKKALYIKRAGVCVGKYEKNVLIPDHELALSLIIHPNLPRLQCELDEALNYLRKQNMSAELNREDVRGWVLVCFQNVPLGWAKCMPGRINNYFPKEWRITHL